MQRGGAEAVEMIIWLIMRGALGGRVTRAHRTYDVPGAHRPGRHRAGAGRSRSAAMNRQVTTTSTTREAAARVGVT